MGDDPDGYRFGQFEVDRRTGELRNQGRRLKLRGRPVDILLALVARPGELVTRDELRARLWPADTFVDFDHGLHSAVNRLRETLGDSADNPRFIETLPRKGYRFIAPVSPIVRTAPVPAADTPVPGRADTPVPPASAVPAAGPPTPIPVGPPADGTRFSPRAIALAVVTAAALGAAVWTLALRGPASTAPLTIVVIPFDNLSGDTAQDYLSDGFTEELISELGMIGPTRLAVIGRTTSMVYKGARKSVGEIGKEVRAGYLLAGSVRRAGSRLRITAQLVNTTTMAHLWSNSFDRDVGDILMVQREVAREIASSLALALSPSSRETPSRTSSFAAYEYYMRGRVLREQATAEGAATAIEQYERAIAIDPNYAAAHAAIADAYRLLGAPGWEVDRPAVLLARAKTAAERALALDPQSPQARAVLAMIKFNYDWDLDGAAREIEEALRLNPSFAQAHQYYSGILMCQGRMEAAIAAAARAVDLDPRAPTATTSLGVRYYYAGRLADAREQFLKTLEVTPGFSVAHWGLAQIFRLEQRYDDQLEQLRTAARLANNSSYMRAHLAYGYAVAGDRERAMAIARELEGEGARQYVAPYHLALIFAGLRDADATLRWLERAFDDRSGWLVFLAVEPEFEWMRGRADFQQLLARAKPAAR